MFKHIDRYESDWNSSYDLFVMTYESGEVRTVMGFKNLPNAAKDFIAAAPNFEFMKNKETGEYFHRFSA